MPVHGRVAWTHWKGIDPTQMCQTLVDKVAPSRQLRAITNPDLLVLFEDWFEELESDFVMVKADVTKVGGPLHERLMREHAVKGVPTIVFLDGNGGEQPYRERISWPCREKQGLWTLNRSPKPDSTVLR